MRMVALVGNDGNPIILQSVYRGLRKPVVRIAALSSLYFPPNFRQVVTNNVRAAKAAELLSAPSDKSSRAQFVSPFAFTAAAFSPTVHFPSLALRASLAAIAIVGPKPV
jgi:hypothetical protein